MRALRLLPAESRQAEWIRRHASELQRAAVQAETPSQPGNWAKRLGPLGPVAVLLVKGKGLLTAIFKLKFLLSLTAFVGVYWALYGAWFGAGFAVLVLIHEMGHFIEIKRRGLPAEMPVFLPGLGAYVRWQALGVSAETRAVISLAGPMAGWLAAAACLVAWWRTGNGLWAALARSSAWLNVANLMPVWVLDGGQAASVLGKTQRMWLLTAGLGLWLVLGEGVFFLVVVGAAWRLFAKDLPAQPSRLTMFYFLWLLVALGLLLRLVPGTGFGPQ